jgi:hypothetical protein
MTLVESGRLRVAVRLELRYHLLGHGRLGPYLPMVALSVVLLCRRPRLAILELGNCWGAHRPSCRCRCGHPG